MPFHERLYVVFLLLVHPEAPPLWHSDSWQSLVADIDPYMVSPRGKSTVRSLQYSAAGKPLAFGRLVWDAKSHSKWAHSGASFTDVRFAHVEAWSPSWNQCAKDDLAPDFYLALANERALGWPEKQLRFNQRLVFAIAEDLGPSASLAANLAKLAARLPAVAFARTSRPWGHSIGGGGFTSAIQDMVLTHLFKPGDPHATPLTRDSFSEPWEFVSSEA